MALGARSDGLGDLVPPIVAVPTLVGHSLSISPKSVGTGPPLTATLLSAQLRILSMMSLAADFLSTCWQTKSCTTDGSIEVTV